MLLGDFPVDGDKDLDLPDSVVAKEAGGTESFASWISSFQPRRGLAGVPKVDG